MAELLGEKYRTGIDPSDPILMMATLFEESQKRALDKLGAVMTKAAEDIATTTVLTENSARARCEQIVTEAGRWAGEQIRMAGADSGKLAADVVREFLDRTEAAARTATIAAWVSSSAAVATAAAAVGFLVLR